MLLWKRIDHICTDNIFYNILSPPPWELCPSVTQGSARYYPLRPIESLGLMTDCLYPLGGAEYQIIKMHMSPQEELLAITKRNEAAKAVGTIIALIIFAPLISVVGLIVYVGFTM